MPSATPLFSAKPFSARLRSVLLGPSQSAQIRPQNHTTQVQNDSIVIWPQERTVARTDFAEVTLWQAPAGAVARNTLMGAQKRTAIGATTVTPRVLSVTGLTNTTDRYSDLHFSNKSITAQNNTQIRPTISLDTVPSAPIAEQFVTFAPLAGTTKPPTANRSFLRFGLLSVMLLSLIVMASVVIPDVYYRLMPESATEVAITADSITPVVIEPVAPAQPELPPVDPTLPTGEYLRIPTIGVDAGVQATLVAEEALESGAWRVPDFGTPLDFSQPTIIASHRYGWLWWWQSDFGKKNSFYYLPETQLGDTIEVITDQRRFTYEIYAKEEGQTISDYSADLILYTCKFLNSPERYFVYAKRVPAGEQPTANDSQSGDTVNFDKT